ncbi:MAG: hypothetical protein H6919_07165 [Sphingomonadaceae bacterium]|nr:hypothetical protein [Altererythrobacter sp.]MCP5393677.1 hypothetical protein [Sphingomonadaceae bacterium]
MIATGSRLRQIGWAVVLTVCLAGFVALTFRVNAVKSEVRLAERQIIALEREKMILETEFQARANQQQLADWNRIEFGYSAPAADQYLENERQLASLGVPRGVDAPDPIRVAKAPVEQEEDGILAMVSPLTGKPAGADEAAAHQPDRQREPMSARRPLSERLAMENPLHGASAEAAQ